MLIGVQLDGVVIGATHKAHYDLGMKAIESGLNVFMEKPMTTGMSPAAVTAGGRGDRKSPSDHICLLQTHLRHGSWWMQSNAMENYLW